VQWAIGFFALGIVYLLLATLQSYSFARIGANLGERVRRLFYRAVLYMEVGWFDQDANTSGALTSRLANDAPMVRGAVSDVLGLMIQNVVMFVAAYVVAFINGWRMTLLIAAVLPLLGAAAWVQMKFYAGAHRTQAVVACNEVALPCCWFDCCMQAIEAP
jgi:ATP-binding cassette, subfamily B (MDR/TAP), member 1